MAEPYLTRRDRVREAKREHDRAQKKYHKAVAANFNDGADVNWLMRGHVQIGRVIRTSYDRLFVENSATRKRYWIHAYDLY